MRLVTSTTIWAMAVLATASCASDPQRVAYDDFLNRIAAECRPLVIGSENIGQALVVNGIGADPDKYTAFLSQTKALYFGGIPPATYSAALTAFVGAGTQNQRSIDCIVAHLPRS